MTENSESSFAVEFPTRRFVSGIGETPSFLEFYANGRRAIIRERDGRLVYEGNMPVDEAAQMFFEDCWKQVVGAGAWPLSRPDA